MSISTPQPSKMLVRARDILYVIQTSIHYRKRTGGGLGNISRYWLKSAADNRYFCALKYP